MGESLQASLKTQLRETLNSMKINQSLQASIKSQLRETLNSMKLGESMQASIKNQLRENLEFYEKERIAAGILKKSVVREP